MNKLKVCEIFASIQGEGVTTGVPTVFVRFSGCNLSCDFCDSVYAMTEAPIRMTAVEAKDKICELAGITINTVVLTGGEPLLYQKTEAFINLLRLLKTYRFRIEVETNGTILPTLEVAELVDQFNNSLKLSNSGVDEVKRIKSSACTFFANNLKTWFKFVITAEEDIKEVQELQLRFNIRTDKILLMPEGRTEAEIQGHAKMVVDMCMIGGYTFCNRLHILLWGSKRGI